MKGLPLNPPPEELVSRAMDVAVSQGLQVHFTTILATDPAPHAWQGDAPSVLTWVVKITTDRGTITAWPGQRPDGPTDWLGVLHELGLVVA